MDGEKEIMWEYEINANSLPCCDTLTIEDSHN